MNFAFLYKSSSKLGEIISTWKMVIKKILSYTLNILLNLNYFLSNRHFLNNIFIIYRWHTNFHLLNYIYYIKNKNI